MKLTAASEFQTGSFAFALPYVTEVPTSFELEFDAFIGGGTSPLDDPHRLDMAERDYEPIGGNGLALVYGILTSQPYDRGLNYRDLHRPHVVRTTATGGPTTVMADGTPYPGMKNPKAPPTYIPDGNTIRPGAGAGEYVNSGVERVWDAAAPGWAITRATETVGFYSSQQTSSWDELEPFGEFGPRGGSFVGLRLSLLTYTARLLEVAWRPAAETELQVLATVPLGASLRVLSWVGVRLAMTPAGRLDVWYDGTRYVHELEVPGFRAAVEKSWEWGFGASTHRATDHHWVDNVVLSSFALAKPTAYPLSLTLNRQQFYNASATFAYRPPPVISAVHPRSGPRAGATAVTLYGANLEGGTDYKCRFGAPHAAGRPGGRRSVYDRSESAAGGVYTWATNHSRLPLEQFMTAATYVPTADLPYAGRRQVFGAGSVVCESPNASVVGPHDGPDDVIALEVALNGRDYTVGLNFSRHAPELKAVYPTSGPDAGFVIELSGEALTEGTAYRCRFEATYLEVPPPPSPDAPPTPPATPPAPPVPPPVIVGRRLEELPAAPPSAPPSTPPRTPPSTPPSAPPSAPPSVPPSSPPSTPPSPPPSTPPPHLRCRRLRGRPRRPPSTPPSPPPSAAR